MQIQDIFKFLYQSTFGCEHFITSFPKATEMIAAEYAKINKCASAAVEELDGDYGRVPLSLLDSGLTAETLAGLFLLSSKGEKGTVEDLRDRLAVASELVSLGELPFSPQEFANVLARYERENFPPVHHSDIFRESYHPSYRVISGEYIPFLPLLTELDKRLSTGRVILALEGGSAAGKTTLGRLLKELYGAVVFHMDDFFLQPEQRMPQRYAEIGGNVDRERFLEEVLVPLSEGRDVLYRRFDCQTMTLSEAERVQATKLVVVEGVYSMHPRLQDYYDFSVFLDIDPRLQRERILRRNTPQLAGMFFDRWIPLENRYFEATDAGARCDMKLSVSDK